MTTRLRGYGRGKEGQKNVLDTSSAPYSDIAPCQAFSKCRPMCVSGGVAIGPWYGCIRRVGRVGPGRVDPRSILRSLTPVPRLCSPSSTCYGRGPLLVLHPPSCLSNSPSKPWQLRSASFFCSCQSKPTSPRFQQMIRPLLLPMGRM